MFDSYGEKNFAVFYFLVLPVIGLIIGYVLGKEREWITWGYNRIEQNNGEALVRQSLKEYCKSKEAHVLNCVTVRLEDGSTTQIDHILVCTRGVFVIETKHYSGWIFGDSKARRWTKVLFRDKYTFQNPLHQNLKHVKAIQRVLDFVNPKHIHNIVVFSGDALLQTVQDDRVCYLEGLIPRIEQYPEGILSLNHVQYCVGRIEYRRM